MQGSASLGAAAAHSADADSARRFGGVARVYGAAALAAFGRAHAAVVGVGGVGSWAAEALARSGVGALSLIDLDHIAESNTNRQIHALGDEYGRAKAMAMAERAVAINPDCRAVAVEEFVTPENVAGLLPACDIVLDCIDQVSAKAALVAHCRARGIAIVTCGAAGGRLDPTRIGRDDLARVRGDPLLAAVRYRLRRRFGFERERAGRLPKFGVLAVFSDEPVRRPASTGIARQPAFAGGLACAGYGSVVTVTATLGLAAAAAALDRLAGDTPRAVVA